MASYDVKMDGVQVALLQLPPAPDVVNALIGGITACEEAASHGADIAVFPEMWSNGYSFFREGDAAAKESWVNAAVSLDSDFIGEFRKASRRLELAIAITFLEEHRPSPRNSVMVFDCAGALALHYSKVHLATYGPEAHCTAGERFSVCTLKTKSGAVRVGAMICFDREFPESARVLALLGAELVLIPNACWFDEHRTGQLKTRAFENMFGVAMANYPGEHPEANGRSLAVSPIAWERPDPEARSQFRETILLEAGAGAGIFYGRFDLPAMRAYRKNAIWGPHFRVPEAYYSLVDRSLCTPYIPNQIID